MIEDSFLVFATHSLYLARLDAPLESSVGNSRHASFFCLRYLTSHKATIGGGDLGTNRKWV